MTARSRALSASAAENTAQALNIVSRSINEKLNETKFTSISIHRDELARVARIVRRAALVIDDVAMIIEGDALA